jgi:hypothetical protein
VAALQGYKQVPSIENGALRVDMAEYAGWEANCCPSGNKVTLYRLRGDALVAESVQREGFPRARAMTVTRYYELLQARQYAQAYQFLGPAFRSANPYDTWVAGYATTQRIEAEVSENPDGSLGVQLRVTERSGSGGEQVRRFSGRWFLTYSADAKQWLLDRAEIQPAP